MHKLLSHLLLIAALSLAAVVYAQDQAEETEGKDGVEKTVEPVDPRRDATMPEFSTEEPEAELQTFVEKDKDGKLVEQFTYYEKGGVKVKHGKHIRWWKGGEQKRQEYTYVRGYLHGPQRMWYPNGRIWKEFSCVQGKRDGSYVEYRSNGRPKKKMRYEMGKYKDVRRYKPTGQD